MFEYISDRFGQIFDKLRYGGKLSEDNIREGLRDVRRALLEADVNVQVVRDFLAKVEAKAIGESVINGVHPGQQVVQIVHDALMGEGQASITYAAKGPTVILMAGLQGSGKTTTCAKLAKLVKEQGKKPLLVAADLQRPAAIEQLKILGGQLGVPVFHQAGLRPADLCAQALVAADIQGCDVVILDTAGRLHNKVGLMDELGKVKRVVEKQSPIDEVLLVLDATTGQNGLRQAEVFREVVNVTGIVLTKLDGTAKGGIVVAVQRKLGVPVKLVGLGEGPDDMAPFDPEAFVDALIS